ncbi:MAG: MFS transporter [Verrucomicrobia bacterium]|nr:MFS transporter [Verrucomicrobiota bacterium]
MNAKTRWPVLLFPLFLGLAHGVADGSAGLLLGHLPESQPELQVVWLVLLYNAFGFGGQPLVAWFADHFRFNRLCAIGGLLSLALALSPLTAGQPLVAVLLAGLGSAAFHVGAGALALLASDRKADGAGLFAAPGVVGLGIGGALAVTHHFVFAPFCVLLVALSLGICFWPARTASAPGPRMSKEPCFEAHDWIMVGLLVAISLRSLVWTAFQFALAGQVQNLLYLALAAGFGKIAGGFLAERLGYRRWALIALCVAAPLLAFAGKRLSLLIPGVALLQSTIPCSLAAFAQILPARPALATGLVFGLAVVLGGLPSFFTDPANLVAPVAVLLVLLLAGLCFWQAIGVRRPNTAA